MTRVRTRTLVVVGLLVAVSVVVLAGTFASRSPDGLMHTAADQGFATTQKQSATAGGPLAGYRAKGVGDEHTSRAVAGVAGCLVVLVVITGAARLAGRRRKVGS